jgi:hypothetical protein
LKALWHLLVDAGRRIGRALRFRWHLNLGLAGNAAGSAHQVLQPIRQVADCCRFGVEYVVQRKLGLSGREIVGLPDIRAYWAARARSVVLGCEGRRLFFQQGL